MRQFDSRYSWLDDKGQPLVGRVKFCKLHTTVLENIWNITGNVPLQNPMYTNQLGQLMQQVFLADKDYTIRFEKYIGHSRMQDDEDEQNWLFIYSCDNLYDTFNISVDSPNIQAIDCVNDLRSLNPYTVQDRTGIRIVEVLGYYQPGDVEPVRYVWNEDSVESDNGGNIIKNQAFATGRWELVNNFNYMTGVDVRHFGVFGADTYSAVEQTMPAKIGIANTYAMSIGYPLYFGSNDGDLTWYKINGNLNGAYFAKRTRIFADTNVQADVIVADENSYLDVWSSPDFNHKIVIKGDVVKTSWGENSTGVKFDPSLILEIDSQINTHHKSFENIKVNFTYNTDSCTFTNCELNSVGKIGNDCVFHNCILKEYMFNPLFTTATVYDDCVIDIEDWPTTSKWLYLVTQNTAKPLDFKGRTVDSTCTVGWAHCTYENAVFSNFIVTNNTANFVNCSGNVGLGPNLDTLGINGSLGLGLILNNNTVNYLNMQDCQSVTFGANVTINKLYAVNCTFNDPDYQLTLGENGFKDCNLNCKILTNILSCNNCSILGIVNCVTPSMVDCQIYKQIYQTAQSTQANFLFLRCTFSSDGEHHLAGTIGGTTVVGTWNGNYAADKHPITVDMTRIYNSDMAHTYKYENNTGKFLSRKPSITYTDGGFKKFPSIIVNTSNPAIGGSSPRLIDLQSGLAVTHQPLMGGIYIPVDFGISMPCFSIGTKYSFLRMKITFPTLNGTLNNDSSTWRPTEWYTFEATQPVSIPDAANYMCRDFNDTVIGPMVMYPKNVTSPQDYDGVGSNCYITLELLK